MANTVKNEKKESELLNKNVTYYYDDYVNIKEYEERRLYINGEIDEFVADEIVNAILDYNRQDKGIEVSKRKPVLLYVTSVGGSVIDGFAIIDAILNSKTKIITVNLSYQYSMGFLIGLAGHERYATPNATFLMHDGSNFVFNSTAKVGDQLKFQEQQEKRTKDYILSRSKLTAKKYDQMYRVEWQMYSDEAKSYGFTDYIIGVDCDIDSIL